MSYKIKSQKTTATYPTGKYRVIGGYSTEKPLMTYEEGGKTYYIKSIDYTETTAWNNFADVEFYNKKGKWTININRIKQDGTSI